MDQRCLRKNMNTSSVRVAINEGVTSIMFEVKISETAESRKKDERVQDYQIQYDLETPSILSAVILWRQDKMLPKFGKAFRGNVGGWKFSYKFSQPKWQFLSSSLLGRAFRLKILCSVFSQKILTDLKTNFTKFELSTTFRFQDIPVTA